MTETAVDEAETDAVSLRILSSSELNQALHWGLDAKALAARIVELRSKHGLRPVGEQGNSRLKLKTYLIGDVEAAMRHQEEGLDSIAPPSDGGSVVLSGSSDYLKREKKKEKRYQESRRASAKEAEFDDAMNLGGEEEDEDDGDDLS
jgi:hypothetical protein